MKLQKKFMRIQQLIALSIICISLFVALMLSWLLYGKFKQITTENTIRDTKNTLEQVNKNAQLYVEQLIQDCQFLESLLVKNQGVIDSTIEERFNTLYMTRGNIISISVLDKDGKMQLITPSYEMKDNINVKQEQWFNKTIQDKELYFITNPSLQELFKYNYKWTYAICANIDFAKNGVKDSLLLRIDMDFSQISELCSSTSLGEKGYVFIVDENENLLYHPDQRIIATGQVTDEALTDYESISGQGHYHNKNTNTIVTKSDMNYVRWSLVGVTFEDEITSISMEVIEFLLITFVISIGMTIAISLFISIQISRPIQQLEKSMQMVTDGDLETRISIKSSEREVVALAHSFNHMVSRIQKLIKQNQKEHELKRKSDLDALQAQINPHFLYNTLDSIVWMAECKQHKEVVEMVNALAKLFRISISGGRNMIPLSDEINHAENYMLIQKKRYNEEYDYKIEVDESILALQVPKLILQPLIENSLYHGLEYMVDHGLIHIKAELKEEDLYIYVIDNGEGMSPDTLKNIWNSRSKHSGVGIKNVNERIQLMFGKEYGLSFESEQEEGTKVTIRLPIVSGDNKNEA